MLGGLVRLFANLGGLRTLVYRLPSVGFPSRPEVLNPDPVIGNQLKRRLKFAAQLAE